MTDSALVKPARDEVLALAATARRDLDVTHLAGVLDDMHYVSVLGSVRVQTEAVRIVMNGGDLRDLRQALDSLCLINGRPRGQR